MTDCSVVQVLDSVDT